MTLPPVTFPTLGFQVADWIEAYLVHGPGDVQGAAFRDELALDDEFVLFLCHAYRVDNAGRRVFRRAILSRPKGRAKSELAGAVVCAELLGPVRCSGFDARGEPVGAAVRAPFIRCLATEEGQAGNTYDNVRVMLTEGAAADEFDLDVGLTRVYVKGGGEVAPATASSASKDGGKETFAVADETHLYVLPELRRMHDTVRRNLAKRKGAEPWMLDTTTAFLPGEGSVAESSFEQYGNLSADDARERFGVLYDHREAPPLRAWNDDRQLRKALRYVYGPAARWMDLERLVAEVRDPEVDEADARRYWLNQRVAQANAWLDEAAYDAVAVDASLEPGAHVTLGFDGSRTNDATALVAADVESGLLVPLAVWERPENPALAAGWEVPSSEVDAAVADAFATYDVARFYADPPFWEAEVDAWHREYGDVVVKYATRSDVRMAAALRRLHTAIVTGRDVAHNGDATLRRHVLNARKRRTRAGDVIVKDRNGSPHKIDAAVAAALAYEARADAIVAGVKRRRPSRAVFL